MAKRLDLNTAVSTFGDRLKPKLSNLAAAGDPEDQLRGPFETLLRDLAGVVGLQGAGVTAVGESRLDDLKTRPDYAVTVDGVLVGYVELKAPGKGADPRRFKDTHDKGQWERLRLLPNVLYSDGNSFMLWQNGEPVGSEVTLLGDVGTSGEDLAAPPGLQSIFDRFLHWEPLPPRSPKELAHVTARLCRFLRDAVTEQLALKNESLTSLATDWRRLLFPDATDERFADGYAQAVTFGMLMARAKSIRLAAGLESTARELGQTNLLIGAALRVLTENAESGASLKTSLEPLRRVLDAVDWPKISKGDTETWLYFYEEFLEVYDNELRKKTGSYYTPPQVVTAMVGLVDEVLRGPRYRLAAGLASPEVTVADPATGTGTFLLGIFRRIAESVRADEGEGAVKAAVNAAAKRLVAFEMQLGPFAVAQLRLHAEITDLTGEAPRTPLRMFVTDTLANPKEDQGWIPGTLAPIAQSRKEANRVKREEPITVVIGNPPYKEKAKGMGGWVESGGDDGPAPLLTWMPPKEWGVGAHSKHLRNLYVYFWRWATWKVFDLHKGRDRGVVCFITVAGFLNGPGFQKMRDYLRRTCDDLWVIDCSPEGHQPEVSTRIFQGVQQPICIVLASRSASKKPETPAAVRFLALPAGHRDDKFRALAGLTLRGKGWIDCPTDGRAPFLPASTGPWASYPALDDLFLYNGSGVMPGRTWIIAPDPGSLTQRWQRLLRAPPERKEELFHPHLRGGEPGDKHAHRVVAEGLPGYEARPTPVADDRASCEAPERYGFRSFDRQWILPDARVINQPNPALWECRSERQVFLTAVSRGSPSNGPALTFTGLVPDLDHYSGRGGRVFPVWRDRGASESNVRPALLAALSRAYGIEVSPEDLVAYVAAVAAHPAYTARFQDDLSTPGLRIPITAKKESFVDAMNLGRIIVWLHTFGERMADPANGRPNGQPRLPSDRRPRVPTRGSIPEEPGEMPDSIGYDASKKRLLVGTGFIERVEPAVWNYEVSGKQVLLQWFSYRKANRERPIIGDRRPPSPLGEIQPDHWLPEYTTELLNVLNVLGWLVELEPAQARLLEEVCRGPLLTVENLRKAAAFSESTGPKRPVRRPGGRGLFGDMET